MKFIPHPFKSDLLELNEEDLQSLARGNTLKVSALEIRKEKPDQVVYPQTATSWDENKKHQWFIEGKLKLTFDGETGKLKSAEVI